MTDTTERDRELLLHLLAAIAYRTQKAVRGAPSWYPHFDAGHGARTPTHLIGHMTSLMGYTETLFRGGSYPFRPEPLPTYADELVRFHEQLERVAELFRSDAFPGAISTERLMQGPLADTLTHVGQLALLRRLADAPVRGENFIAADVRADRLGVDQPLPAQPDAE